MKTPASMTSLADKYASEKAGCYTVLGENIVVMDAEFIEDLRDMGYKDIEFVDLIAEFYDWVEDVTA